MDEFETFGSISTIAFLIWFYNRKGESKKMKSENKKIIVNVPAVNTGSNTDVFEIRKKYTVGINEDNTVATIVIVAYNRLDATKTCIESVLKYTANYNYRLLLVYNDNEQGEGILDYFESVEYEDKIVVHIQSNLGAPFAYREVNKYFKGKYIIHLPNDVYVTSNWLDNLVKCAESDIRIGMVNPVSSNVSNYQQVDIKFRNYDEMQLKASEYNVSDNSKWCERLRIMTLGALFKRECLSVIGDVFDLGFLHNFGDDDIAFRIRRAGYKVILAKDTWIHHNHENHVVDAEKLMEGRTLFREKYFGIDAWDDVNNFIPEILPLIKVHADKEKHTILGVDVRCGTPILEIKNHLRQNNIFDAECCAVTSEGRYFIDLLTVCGADNVVACSPADASDHFKQEVFDYIIIGENINEYPEPFRIIRHVYSLLKKAGQMFVYLKNDYDIYTFLNVIGHRQVRPTKASLNMTIEQFLEQLLNMDIKAEVAGVVPYTNVPEEYINEVNNRTAAFVQDEWSETAARLTADRFIVKIER